MSINHHKTQKKIDFLVDDDLNQTLILTFKIFYLKIIFSFQVESGSLEIWKNGLPLSVQDSSSSIKAQLFSNHTLNSSSQPSPL